MGSSVRPSVGAVCGCFVSSNSLIPIVLKLSRCFVHDLKMCIWLEYYRYFFLILYLLNLSFLGIIIL